MNKQYIPIAQFIAGLCLIATISFGQDSSYYCYSPTGKTSLDVFTKTILVKFEKGSQKAAQLGLLRKHQILKDLKEESVIPFREVSFIELPKGKTKTSVEKLIAGLNEQPGIEYANPFFKMGESGWMTFGEVFAVGLKKKEDYHLLQQMAALNEVEITKQCRYDEKQWFLKTTPRSVVNALLMANVFAESGLFEYAEVDFIKSFSLSGLIPPPPNDPLYAQQWHLENDGSEPPLPAFSTVDADIDAEGAWMVTTGNPNIRIAVIDDGVNTSNTDLTGNLEPGYDATGAGPVSSMTSETGHGNLVAELIAAVGNNNQGGIGVAYTCKVVPVKVFENVPGFGGGTVTRDSWLADGIDWAWQEGNGDVLNNSWGGSTSATIITNAIGRAVSQGRGNLGAPTLFSVGNSGITTIEYPASLSSVIAVGATNACDKRKTLTSPPSCDADITWASNYGTGLDVAAPGNFLQASSNSFGGTSGACPIAAGIVALILSKNPSLTESQARFYLESTCEKVGGYTYNSAVSGQPNGTWSGDLGYGRVNANLALASVPSPPSIDAGVAIITTPVSNCGLSSSETVTALLKNYGTNSLSNIPVEYRLEVNSGSFGTWTSAGTFAGPLASFAESNHTFTVNVSTEAAYTIEVRTQLAGDAVSLNDVASFDFVHRKIISTFPYLEDFETDDGDWYLSAANNPWQWGTPFSGNNHINSAGSGSKCWKTVDDIGANSYYPFQVGVYLYSPCLDFSGMTNDPIISFLLIYQLEDIPTGFPSAEDYVFMELSTNGGSSWATLGGQGTGTNWYNHMDGWTETSQKGPGGWLEATHVLTGASGNSDVRVRFTFVSNSDDPDTDGFGIDKVQIMEPPSNDAGIFSINSPKHSCNMGASELVETIIHNLGNSTITSCPVQYRHQINGGSFTAWTSAGTYNGSIPPGGTDLFIFNADFSAKGTYNLEVRTQLSGDGNFGNDLATHTFQHYNAISSFPYSESFEMGQGVWLEGGLNYTWQMGTPAGSTINSASDGSIAWVTNSNGPFNTAEQSYVQSPCFDFSGSASPQINIDTWRHTASDSGASLEYSTDGGVNWNLLGAFNDPNNWYNSSSILGLNNAAGWSGSGSGWVTATHSLTSVAGLSNVLFRVYFGASTGINSSKEGFAFDNLLISESNFLDVGISAINQPSPFGCALGSSETVQVTIKNSGNVSASGIPVEYRINLNAGGFGSWISGGTYSGTITAGNTATHSFIADFSALGEHVLEVRTLLASDQNSANDVASKTINNLPPSISFFPLCETFEGGPGSWQAFGTSSSWNWGTPNNTTINSASGGTGAFATNLAGNYNNSEVSYLLSPCLDLSSMNFGLISFDLWYETESGKDGLKLQYSVTGGDTWVTEGIQVNGFNNSNITAFSGFDDQMGWSGSSGQWVTVQAFISPLGTADVLYRFIFASDATNNGEGVAIDNICIIDGDTNPIFASAGCSSATVKGVSGNNTVTILESRGESIGYINPNGNKLGTVTLQVNDLASVPTAAGNDFYMPRYFNFSCSGGSDCLPSGNFPQGNVTVGFYFEMQELADYNNAGGTTYTMSDLYATHFEGNNENCTLDDNSGGTYTLINKTNITSANFNGGASFTLDFNVTSFSEIGTSGKASALAPPPPLPIELTGFNARLTPQNIVLLQWTTASEINFSHFEIERNTDGSHWEFLSAVLAKGESHASTKYEFIDRILPLASYQNSFYYRLKIVDLDGSFEYSKIRNVVINNIDNSQNGFTIYPNPARKGIYIFLNATSEVPDWKIVLTDITGKKEIQIKANLSSSQAFFLDFQNFHFPSGTYFLTLFEEKRFWGAKKVVVME